jgi:hypothetical protein
MKYRKKNIMNVNFAKSIQKSNKNSRTFQKSVSQRLLLLCSATQNEKKSFIKVLDNPI